MKIVILFSAVFLCLYGCNIGEPSDGFRTDFRLTDVPGNTRATFHSGEDFIMHFTLTNFSGRDQYYSRSGPATIFEIRQADTLAAASVDEHDVCDGGTYRVHKERGDLRGQVACPEFSGEEPPHQPGAGRVSSNCQACCVFQGYHDPTHGRDTLHHSKIIGSGILSSCGVSAGGLRHTISIL